MDAPTDGDDARSATPTPNPNPRGSSSSSSSGEQPWRRDEVVVLLRAWRQVAAARATAVDARAYKARVFDAFCALAGGEQQQPRSFKSVMKTRKSLARSFRFIAAFNQSSTGGNGSNWFALPEQEQRRVVATHYKRKPFAYIDADMFDAIEMIHAAENASGRREQAATAAETVSAGTVATTGNEKNEMEEDEEDNDRALAEGDAGEADEAEENEEENEEDEEEEDDDDDDDDDEEYGAKPTARRAGRFAKLKRRKNAAAALSKTRGSSENARGGARSGRRGAVKTPTNAWTREDILLLLRAWEAAFDDPRVLDGPAAVFDDAVHEGFGKAQRTATALKIKRYSLTKSHKFISDFNKGKYPTVGGRPVAHRDWFALDKKERAAVVLEHYKKTHFTHLDEDMLAPIARIVQKAKILEPSTAKLKRSESGKFASNKPHVSTPPESMGAAASPSEVDEWERRETTLLIRAWRDTVDGLKLKGASSQAGRPLDERIYQRFVVLSEGDKSRNEQDVAARREALVNTHALISDFNENAGAAGDWFSMRRNERRAMTAQARRPCVDIDEATFVALGRVLQKTEQAKLAPVASPSSQVAPPPPPVRAASTPRPQASPANGKGLNVWNHDELLLLVNAWGAVAAEGPLVANEPLYVLNNRIYKKFVEMAKGRTNRTDKALIAKRESLLQSYFFISDFNEGRIVSSPGRTCDWFALSPADQKYMVKTHFKKTSFSHLDASVVALLDTFMQPEKKARQALAAPPPTPKLQPPPLTSKLPPPTPVAAGVRSATRQEPADAGLSSSSKARPNAWTRDELFHLLRAWREIVAHEPRQLKESVGNFNTRIYQRFLALCAGTTSKAEASVRSKRQLLTTTYEFIADFNRKNFLDWFSLRESDRKKHIVNANRTAHCCSNIEEDVFEALAGILGDKASAKAGTRPSSAVFRQRRSTAFAGKKANDDNDDDDDDDDASDGEEEEDDDEEDASLQAFERARNAHPKSSARVQAERKRHLIANVLAHIGEQGETHTGSFASEALLLPSRKKQKVTVADSELHAIASMFEAQTQHLASLLEQIREERRLEQEERRAFLERIHLDQEERQRDRADRAQDREQARSEWEHFREERKAEREQDRLLLAALTAQQKESSRSSPQQQDDDVSDRELLRSK